MATFPISQCHKTVSRFKDVTDERSYCIKRRCCRKPKYAKEHRINWVRIFDTWWDKNGLEKNPETVRPEQLDKVLERFFACVYKQDGTDHDCGRNLSPMISKGNQMVYWCN